eukprot:scaffold23474_cov125-Cylindrotheca_fusiformis.AAC.3
MVNTLNSIAGSVTSGCFSTLIGHPLDTIKVHQQTKPEFSNYSSLQVAKALAKDGGALKLFRGIGPPMANQILMNTVMFSVFNQVKQNSNDNPYLNENAAAFLAGLFSGFATACLSTPADWIKIQAQISLAETTQKATAIRSLFQREFVKDGTFQLGTMVKTLYRGHVANLGREGVFTMVYLGLYDRICHKIKEAGHVSASGNLDMVSVILASSFTGACAWISNYPFDTIKSIQQARSAGEKQVTILSTMKYIYESNGIRGFFRGVGSSTLRAILVTSSRMLAYEKTLQLLSKSH